MSNPVDRSRRQFIQRSALTGGVLLTGLPGILRAQQAPALIAADSARPLANQGLKIGDVLSDRAIVWSRADREARMFVEWSLNESFAEATEVPGPHALAVSDFTSRVDLSGLPSDAEIFVRVLYENLDSGKARSDPVVGRFRTAPRKRRDVRFLWSGDTAGQGWGINPDIGGMTTYETMRRTEADFFIHSGDTIYADGPMLDQVPLANGTIWRNAFLDQVPAKRKVAEALDDFRGAHLYNLFDENMRRFHAEVPQVWQWDDHETLNNWSDSKDLSGDPRYTEKRVQTLAARAERAFLEYAPLRWHPQDESERVYRLIPYGGDLDVFVLDMRSYRGPNSFNRQPAPGQDTAFLGRAQLDWLKRNLKASRATWKAIAADMPIGLLVGDGKDAQGRDQFEAVANGDGPVLGREFEFAELFQFIKREGIANVVWFTADVHYTAAHFYDPRRAQFRDFDPFWEFVSGPLNAGTFGPNALDNTFGPQAVFVKAPPAGQANLPPSAGMQFFGQVDIDHRSKEMTVSLKDMSGATLFSQRLEARPGRGRGGWEDD